jgi:hypothetical protein
MNQQQMAWQTIRLNKRFGLRKDRITQSKIDRYIETHKPNDRIRTFVTNLHLNEQVLARKTNTSIKATRRFVPWLVQSVLDNEPRIGKPITNPDLIRYRNRLRMGNHLTTNVKGKFVSDGKLAIHDRIKELMLQPESPKEGVVATLAYQFSLESKLIQEKELKNIMFHSYEYPYKKKVKITRYNKIYRIQQRMLFSNKKLGQRCVAFFSNINEVLHHETQDRFAHLFLDYCGSITTNQKTLEHALENKLVKKGGLIWVTLCSRSCAGDRVTKQLPLIAERFSNDYQVQIIRNHKLFRYISKMDKRKKRGKTMFTMIFRRIK